MEPSRFITTTTIRYAQGRLAALATEFCLFFCSFYWPLWPSARYASWHGTSITCLSVKRIGCRGRNHARTGWAGIISFGVVLVGGKVVERVFRNYDAGTSSMIQSWFTVSISKGTGPQFIFLRFFPFFVKSREYRRIVTESHLTSS